MTKVTIHINWLSRDNKTELIKIEKEDFRDAVEHAELIMKNADVLGVQITWEKGIQ
jgi:hypothetical protein